MFSIIVPFADKGSELIEPFLGSLYPINDDDEVIFVGNSKDKTIKVLEVFTSIYKNMKVVRTDIGSCFGHNVNVGSEAAKQKLLIITNNDVVFPKNFLVRMLSSYKNAKNPGMIGPLSNYVMKSQFLETSAPLDVEGINSCLKLLNIFSPIISGFCFLIEKDLFHKVGGFDKRLENGNEDVDLSIRLLEAGYTNYVNNFTYVFHKGSHSLPKELAGGTYNRHILAKKHFPEKRKHKIGCYLTVKASEEEIKLWLNRHKDIFDIIFIISDCKGMDWSKFESYNNIAIDQSLVGASEGARRARGIQLARWAEVDALVNLDHDEFFEEKVDNAYLQSLLNLPLPGRFAFAGRFLHLWNSSETFREDYPPKQHIFMVKLLPGIPYKYHEKGGMFHGARLPQVCPENIAFTNVRIKHTGYKEAEIREKKRVWYEKTDPAKSTFDIGAEDYFHMVRQQNMTLLPWNGDSSKHTVSLNMMAEHERPHLVQMALENISASVDEIVFRTSPERVDLGEIAERFGAKVIYSTWKDDFSFHRNEMLAGSIMRYIFYADPDEIVSGLPELVDLINLQPDGAIFTVDTGEMLVTEAIRLFVKEGTKFDGIIHESVEASLGKNIIRADTAITHRSNTLEKREFYHKMNGLMMIKNPSDPRPYLDEGIRCKYDGKLTLAEQLIRRSIQLQPDYIQAKVELIRLLLLHAHLISKDVNGLLNDLHPLKGLAKAYINSTHGLVNPFDRHIFLGE